MTTRHRGRIWFAVGCLNLLTATSASAETPRALICKFVGQHSTQLPDGVHATISDSMSFTFASIDAGKRSAQAIGSAGAVDVTALIRPGNLRFVEVTPTGNLAITSVFSELGPPERMPAVHSRHMLMGADMAIVSQYVGLCEAKS